MSLFTKQAVRAERAPSPEHERIAIEILEKLTASTPLRRVRIQLWNGRLWPTDEPKPATLVLNSPAALRAILGARSEVELGEAFLDGHFEVEGDLETTFELGDIIAAQTMGWSKTLSMASLLLRLPVPSKSKLASDGHPGALKGRQSSLERDRDSIRFHYDISNDFYALWLDPRMVYSCAYFEVPEMDLASAQVRKLDLACRKLGLRAGERLLDIGCGWGGLLIHAAKKYGVCAEGITLSKNQFDWTRDLIAKHGLEKQVAVRLADYRELNEPEAYDKIVSVGMVEHVAQNTLPDFFAKVRAMLKPGGLFLNHGIGEGPTKHINRGETFIHRYVFPDSELIPICSMLEVAESAQWEVRDVESLREHYVITLRHWVRRLEASHDEIVGKVGERAYRIWRAYMAGSAHSFQFGYLSIYQTLFAKMDAGGESGANLTREKWYLPKN